MSDDSTGDAEAIEAAVEAAAMQHSLAEPTEAGWLRCSEAFRKAAMNIVRPQVEAALPIIAKHAAAQALRAAEVRMFGTEDGGFLADNDASIPVGEFRRLLRAASIEDS